MRKKLYKYSIASKISHCETKGLKGKIVKSHYNKVEPLPMVNSVTPPSVYFPFFCPSRQTVQLFTLFYCFIIAIS